MNFKQASEKMPNVKVCALCHNEFSKRQGEGNKQWLARRYCSKFCAGKATKGRKLSEKACQNIRDGHLGKTFTLEHRKKISLALKGRTLTPETKALLSDIASKRKLSEEHKARIGDSVRGNRHPNWKGGITPIIFALRKSKEYRHWRNAVLERDGFRCQKCHKSNRRLDAHHIFSFTLFPELRFDVSNGITVYASCHTKYKSDLCQLVLKMTEAK